LCNLKKLPILRHIFSTYSQIGAVYPQALWKALFSWIMPVRLLRQKVRVAVIIREIVLPAVLLDKNRPARMIAAIKLMDGNRYADC